MSATQKTETPAMPVASQSKIKFTPKYISERAFFRAAQLTTLMFVGFPIFWLLLTSFKNQRDAFTTKVIFPPTLANYLAIFTPPLDFGPKIINSIIVSVVTVSITIPFAAMAAYVFSRYTFRGNTGLFVTILATQFIPPIVVVIPFFALFRNLGLIDNIIALIIVDLAVTTPYAIWLIKGFIDALPPEIEEAAFVDGCNELKVLQHVTFPLIMPGVMIAAIFTFISVWNEFLFAFVLTHSKAQTVMIGLLNTQGIKGIIWEQMAAGGLLVMIPVFLFSIKIRNHFVQGLTMGAVK